MVDGPKLARRSAERMLECEIALGVELKALTRDAEAAGWARDEIAMALMILSKSYLNTSRPLGSRYNGTVEEPDFLRRN